MDLLTQVIPRAHKPRVPPPVPTANIAWNGAYWVVTVLGQVIWTGADRKEAEAFAERLNHDR